MCICVEINVEKNMGIICCDKSIEEYASLLFTEDLFDPTDAMLKTSELNENSKQRTKL